tara:strand:- start:1618 stop:3021 length:1404 start_codon:yes stop_codon:yes gene_type:complete
MSLRNSIYEKPLSLTGLGGGATSLGLGGAGVGNHFYFTFPTGGGYPQPYDIQLDSSGNLYVCGKKDTSAGFVLKFNSKGALQWGKEYNTSSIEFYGIEVDSSHNVYVAGSIYHYGYWFFVMKYNSSGVIQWERQLGNTTGSHDHTNYCLTIDGGSNVYLGGKEDYGGSGDPMFFAKWNSSGTLQWQKRLQTGTYLDTVHSMDAEGGGNRVYVTGLTYQPTGSGNIYIGVITQSSGGHFWSRLIRGNNGAGTMTYRNFDCATYGNDVFVAASVHGADAHGGGQDILVTRYNYMGSEQWCRIIGSTSNAEYVRGIATDSSGNCYVIGYNDSFNVILLKLNSSGVLQWQRTFSGTGNEFTSGPAIKVDDSGSFYFAVQTTTPIGGANTPRHCMIVKLPVDGSLTGTYGDFTYAASSYLDSPRGVFSNISVSSSTSVGPTETTTSFSESAHTSAYGDTAFNPTFSELTYFD